MEGSLKIVRISCLLIAHAVKSQLNHKSSTENRYSPGYIRNIYPIMSSDVNNPY